MEWVIVIAVVWIFAIACSGSNGSREEEKENSILRPRVPR